MASEYILLFLSKYKYRIIFYNLLLYAFCIGLSYHFNGRYFKASLDFYIINSSFTAPANEEVQHKLFPSIEEIEIIGSISKSSELFDAVVKKDSLAQYYQSGSALEAAEILKTNTVINIGKKGKITINVKDFEGKRAHKVANHIMMSIYDIFTQQSKKIRANTQNDLEYRINYYNSLKEKIINENFTNKNINKEVFEIPADSLYNYKMLKRIQGKTGIDSKEIINIISGINKIAEIDSKVFALNDQLNKTQQSILSFNRNNLIVLNNSVPHHKEISWKEHFIESVKYIVLINALWITLLMVYRHYKREIDLIFNPKSH